MSEWAIAKSRLVCAATRHEIPAGEFFWSRLVERVNEEGQRELVREDFSEAAWPPSDPSFCFWRSLRQEEVFRGPRILDTHSLFEIFCNLDADSDEARQINFRYLLALLLMRKKMLREKEKSEPESLYLTDGVDSWMVTVPVLSSEDRRLAEEDIGQLIVGLPGNVPS